MKKRFNNTQNRLLSEIYRRLNYFHGGDLDSVLLVSFLPHEAKRLNKDGAIVKPFGGKERPRQQNWYGLTNKGKELFKNYVTPNKLSEEYYQSLYDGDTIIDFNLKHKIWIL